MFLWSQIFFKFSAFSLEFQKFFSITRTIFSQTRSEQFWKQNTIVILKWHELFWQNFLYYFRIIFDGDVDPEWVENINSVLDDNRLLTLPNGERLSLPPNVRIMFEVQDLKYATLATVSRCGMVRNNSKTVKNRQKPSKTVKNRQKPSKNHQKH